MTQTDPYPFDPGVPCGTCSDRGKAFDPRSGFLAECPTCRGLGRLPRKRYSNILDWLPSHGKADAQVRIVDGDNPVPED
jgi:hypothetical protein